MCNRSLSATIVTTLWLYGMHVCCCSHVACVPNSSSDIALENLTVVPVSLSTVLLEWKVTPPDGHHCIRNYNIQIAGPNGSQWREEIPGTSQSFHFTGLQLIHLQNYTCCVTANLYHNRICPINQTLTVNLQGTC